MPTSLRIRRGCQTQTSWLLRLLIGMYETTKCRAVGGTFQSARTVKEHADVGEIRVLLSYVFFFFGSLEAKAFGRTTGNLWARLKGTDYNTQELIPKRQAARLTALQYAF